MAYQKGKLNQEFLSVASLGNNQPTGIIQKATDGYAKNAYGKPIDNGGFLTELNLLGKSEQNKEEINEYSISGYSEVVKSENLLNPDLFKTNLDTYSINVANITENIFLILWVSPYAKIIADRKILLTNIQNNGTIEVTFTITQTENVRIQIGYDSDGVVINDIELQSGTYSIITSYTKTENIIKFSNLCLRVGNETTYIPYFDPYIKNAGLKNYFDKSTVSNKKRLTDKGNIIDNNSWNTSDFINVENQKQFTFMWTSNENYVQVRIIGYDTSNNFVKIILDVNTQISTNLALNFIIDDSIITKLRISYSFKVGNVVCERNNIMLLNGTYEYFNTYIPYDSHYYLVASDNTLINLGTEPLRQNDIASTNGEKFVNREVYTFTGNEKDVFYDTEKKRFIFGNFLVDKFQPPTDRNEIANILIADFETKSYNYIDTYKELDNVIGGLLTTGNYITIRKLYFNGDVASFLQFMKGKQLEYQTLTETKQRNTQNAIKNLPSDLTFTDYHKDNITNTMTTITTPTANFPEEINSLVNPIMDYNSNYNNTNITIPYTLRSINENNVSDYIKIEKGKVVLVQCVGEYVATGNERYWDGVEVTEHGYTSFNIYSGLSKQKGGNSAYSNWYKNKKTHGSFYLSNGIFMVTQQGYLILRDDFFKSDLPRWVQYLKDMYAKGTPLKIQYILETPIETDITNTEFGNNILNFVRNDFKGGDSYFTLNDSNNNLVHLKYYSTDYQENGEPTTAEKDPITNRYTILIQPIIDNKGIEANVDWVKKEVLY